MPALGVVITFLCGDNVDPMVDSDDLVRMYQDKPVAIVELNRPDVLNALSTATARALANITTTLANDEDVRVVVLAGAGQRAFCVGADLKERNAMSDDEFVAQRVVFRQMFDGLRNLPQPVVAAVHGFALGGGLELALCCDIIVADETAVVGLPEVTIGLVPGGGGTQLTTRRLGPGRAAYVVLTGGRLPAGEAHELGLVDRLVPAGSARMAAEELARDIAANSPVATRAAKRALRAGWGQDDAVALDVEDVAWRTAALSADRREGIAAFNEKRPPEWPGR